MAPSKRSTSFPLQLMLLLLAAACAQLSPASAQLISTPVTQIPANPSELAALTVARAAYFSSVLAGGVRNASAGGSPATEGRNLAATPVGLSGGYLSLQRFLVTIAIGTPPVAVPLILDTGSQISWTEGPACVICPGDTSGQCNKNPFGPTTSSNCPYTGTRYNPAASSTAVASTCADCAAGAFGNAGCFNQPFSPAGTCQFISQYGSGYAAGTYAKDVVSLVGSSGTTISTGTQRIFMGATIFDLRSANTGIAGLLGFGPTAPSFPFQLKQVRVGFFPELAGKL